MNKLDEVILFLVEQTNKSAKKYSQRILDEKGIDITVDQWVLLKIIEENDGLSQKELAQKSLRDAASITRTLDLLEKKNYLNRNPIAGNRRQYSISITESAKGFIKANMNLISSLRAKSVEGLSEIELKILADLLTRVKNNMT